MKSAAWIILLLLLASAAPAEELAIGSAAPRFTLVNAVDGRKVPFTPGGGRISVLIFFSNQCPYARAFEDRIVSLGKTFEKRGVSFILINSNDVATHPEESLMLMRSRAQSKDYPFLYLKDPHSSVAKMFGARVTPHVFVIDGSGKIRYRGYVDDSAKLNERQHTGLSDAVNALLEKKPVKVAETKAFGCTIKWKK